MTLRARLEGVYTSGRFKPNWTGGAVGGRQSSSRSSRLRVGHVVNYPIPEKEPVTETQTTGNQMEDIRQQPLLSEEAKGLKSSESRV